MDAFKTGLIITDFPLKSRELRQQKSSTGSSQYISLPNDEKGADQRLEKINVTFCSHSKLNSVHCSKYVTENFVKPTVSADKAIRRRSCASRSVLC